MKKRIMEIPIILLVATLFVVIIGIGLFTWSWFNINDSTMFIGLLTSGLILILGPISYLISFWHKELNDKKVIRKSIESDFLTYANNKANNSNFDSDGKLRNNYFHQYWINNNKKFERDNLIIWKYYLYNLDFSQFGLNKVNLDAINLSDSSLIRADLNGANLIEADLNGANLSGANLIEADLSGANLSGANLSGADLSEANLIGANLIGANLIEADLNGANLSGANLSGANLYQATFDLEQINVYKKILKNTRVITGILIKEENRIRKITAEEVEIIKILKTN